MTEVLIADNINANQIAPTLALIFHCDSVGKAMRYATVHPISTGHRGESVIGPGRFIGSDDEAMICDLLQGKPRSQSAGWRNPRVIYADGQAVMWWAPQTQRPMTIIATTTPATLVPHWPALLFCATREGLFVAALPSSAQPGKDTALCHFPGGNVYADGRVCTGNARCPTDWSEDSIAAWEAMFYDSAFTHTNNLGAIPGQKSNAGAEVLGYWKRIEAEGHAPGAEDMNPMRMDVEDFLALAVGKERL